MAGNGSYQVTTKPCFPVMLFYYDKGITGEAQVGFGTYVVLAVVALYFLATIMPGLSTIFAFLIVVALFAGFPFALYVTAVDYRMFLDIYNKERGITADDE